MPHRRWPLMRAIISGGGTGGHIFPAIAIAGAIKEKWPNAEILFVGAKGRMEMTKVPEAGYSIEGLRISGFQRKSSLKNLLLPFKVISSIWNSFKIIKKFKPDVAIGVGGYASGPLLYVASRMNIPTIIQEQNSYPGVTNRMLAGRVNKICVAFEGMQKYFPSEKIVVTGNPVRNLNLPSSQRSDAYAHFNLEAENKTVLVTGGSLGSGTLNLAMKAAKDFISQHSEIQWIWQIGQYYWNDFSQTETAQLPNVFPTEFIRSMDKAYLIADVVICRAGALTLSEIALCGKPSILVPSPNVAEDHQTKNAMSLVESDAAIMVRDDQLVEILPKLIQELIFDESKLKIYSSRIAGLARPRAKEHIVEVIENLFN